MPADDGKLGETLDPSEDSPDSTAALIARARVGDPSAVEQLFARHLPALQQWARGRLPQWARGVTDTDDLVQDTLLQTFKRLEVFEPRGVGALQAYLRQAILNRLRDELRKQTRRPAADTLDGAGMALRIEDASPLDVAIGREAVDRYDRALQRLRPEDREAIIARVELDYTYEEMATAFGKPSAEAARKAARRALLRLADEMKRDAE